VVLHGNQRLAVEVGVPQYPPGGVDDCDPEAQVAAHAIRDRVRACGEVGLGAQQIAGEPRFLGQPGGDLVGDTARDGAVEDEGGEKRGQPRDEDEGEGQTVLDSQGGSFRQSAASKPARPL
jgi:hypothetical protein